MRHWQPQPGSGLAWVAHGASARPGAPTGPRQTQMKGVQCCSTIFCAAVAGGGRWRGQRSDIEEETEAPVPQPLAAESAGPVDPSLGVLFESRGFVKKCNSNFPARAGKPPSGSLAPATFYFVFTLSA